MEGDIFEQGRLSFPPYLFAEKKRELFSELLKFPENMSFYSNREELREELLQGDGWKGFISISFQTGERKTVSGAILSNSCDIDPKNVRSLPGNILFAPLIELQKYTDVLHAIGKRDDQIKNTIMDMKRQHVTNVFYLPECPGFIPESLILLDDIHAQPLQDFIAQPRKSLFTLNMYGFYIFLIKLSIHFTRFQEGVIRSASAV